MLAAYGNIKISEIDNETVDTSKQESNKKTAFTPRISKSQIN